MALKDCIIRKVICEIICDTDDCTTKEQTNDTSTTQAARTFKVKGWTEVDGETFCPKCSKES